jgi:hypothetical protein
MTSKKESIESLHLTEHEKSLLRLKDEILINDPYLLSLIVNTIRLEIIIEELHTLGNDGETEKELEEIRKRFDREIALRTKSLFFGKIDLIDLYEIAVALGV